MELITNNLAEALMILGVLALILEVAVLGMSTIILLLLGLSLLATGIMMNFSLLESSLTMALWSNTLITLALAALLWKPLKRMQEQRDNAQVHSDFAELTFTLTEDVNDQGLAHYAYSGISWKLKSEQPLSAGTLVKVVKKEVGVMWVAACE
ncbi:MULTISPECIES: activity regulator of membrane protease YbbK [unclassified Pseudoalteromonas]|uniref:activity regulator of membrane protease YbbK n=1 Tax=unclassified Pseudoalteromonas TaxID=194690 RepID=UPI000CF6C2B5|nr:MULTISPECIES: activity regulator of membrane protease YbbK [unclassified Pseudoalteromonas]